MFSTKKPAKALPLQFAVDILQIPVSVVFGYFIDLTMYLLFWVEPQGYAVKLVALVAGCIVLGFGVYLEVLADVGQSYELLENAGTAGMIPDFAGDNLDFCAICRF